MNKTGIYFLFALTFAIGGDTLLFNGVYPLGILFWILFVVCVVRLIVIDRACKKRDAKLCAKYRDTLNKYAKQIEFMSNEIDWLTDALSMKADKRNNVRTGSKPNNEYFKMLIENEGFNADNRATDTELEEKQGVHTSTIS